MPFSASIVYPSMELKGMLSMEKRFKSWWYHLSIPLSNLFKKHTLFEEVFEKNTLLIRNIKRENKVLSDETTERVCVVSIQIWL